MNPLAGGHRPARIGLTARTVPIVRAARRGQARTDQFFNGTQLRKFIAVTKADRDAFRAGAARAADAVDIGLRRQRHIEIHHMGDAFHINPARGNIRRDKHTRIALLERAQCALALRLIAIAMDRLGAFTGAAEDLHHPVRPMLGPCKYEYTVNAR